MATSPLALSGSLPCLEHANGAARRLKRLTMDVHGLFMVCSCSILNARST